MIPHPVIYGAVVALAVFMIGWTTGMAGATLFDAAFSIAMGAFAAGLFWLVKRRFGGEDG